MNTALFYDTETTGLPLFKEPSEDPRQPHIAQLGACLVDIDSREIIASIDVICRPDGWTIPDEVARIHGITTEHAQLVGIPESLAVEMLLEMTKAADFRVAHNESFDARIVRIACKRFFSPESADEWKEGAAQCTARAATPIMKIPPTDKMSRAGFTKFKTPNLGEAVKHFTGKDLAGAHQAMADVQGCMAVWFALQDLFEVSAA
jgi:DNA polymerase III subunit epsilon